LPALLFLTELAEAVAGKTKKMANAATVAVMRRTNLIGMRDSL
jgi:hypothetical protein